MTGDRTTRLIVAAAAALALADASVVTLALPRLLTELDATVEGLAAVLGVYTVVLALALLPAEALRRRVGGPRLGAVALALFGLACAACAAAPSLEVLLALRAVQALGAAGALVAAFEVLRAGDARGPGRRLWSAAAVIGVAAGPALGGLLTELLDWRAIFAAQVPVVLAAAVLCELRARAGGDAGAGASPSPPAPRAARPATFAKAALALVSASLTAVLFLLTLLLIAGWNLSPLAAAVAVSVLPLAALAAGRARGDAHVRAATGCVLAGAGVLALAFLPFASAWWTVVPQLLAGAGMGLALPALAGELVPERSPREAGGLLLWRHAGIALALVILAPVVASNLDSATERARERGVAVVLDSKLPPEKKIDLAPDVLGGVGSDRPRVDLRRSLAANRGRFTGAERAAYDRLGKRADDTLVQAVAESFRAAFLIAGAFALLAALFVLPARARRAPLAAAAGVALAVPLVYLLLDVTVAPEPVRIADPCVPRELPGTSGVGGFLQDRALSGLDTIACHFHASREELVLALADDGDARRFERRHGVNPRAAGNVLQGLIGN